MAIIAAIQAMSSVELAPTLNSHPSVTKSPKVRDQKLDSGTFTSIAFGNILTERMLNLESVMALTLSEAKERATEIINE